MTFTDFIFKLEQFVRPILVISCGFYGFYIAKPTLKLVLLDFFEVQN